MSVLAEKSEEVQLELIRQYYIDKGVIIDKKGPSNIYKNVLELLDTCDFIASLTNDKDIELLLNAFFSLIITTSAEEAELLLVKFCEFFTDQRFQGVGWQSKAGIVVRVLTNFFHFYSSSNVRLQFYAYKNLLKMCGRACLTNFIDVDVTVIDEYVQKWGLNKDEKREVLRLLHVALLHDSRPDVAAEIMTALLCTYDDSDADRAKEDARECVLTAVLDPTAFSFDNLLRLSAVKRLEKTDSLIYEILKIFVQGRLADYQKFVAKHPNFVKEQLKVDNEILLKKIRMLTLISMAENSQCIALESLKVALDIKDSEELEKFIIDAIRINGKINETKQELVVSLFQYRIFDRPQWELLQRKLTSLLTNVKWAHESIRDAIESTSLKAL